MVLAGTVSAVCHSHSDASPSDRLCHAVFAGSLVQAGMALGLAMECVSESRSTTAPRCRCCTIARGPFGLEVRLGTTQDEALDVDFGDEQPDLVDGASLSAHNKCVRLSVGQPVSKAFLVRQLLELRCNRFCHGG